MYVCVHPSIHLSICIYVYIVNLKRIIEHDYLLKYIHLEKNLYIIHYPTCQEQTALFPLWKFQC